MPVCVRLVSKGQKDPEQDRPVAARSGEYGLLPGLRRSELKGQVVRKRKRAGNAVKPTTELVVTLHCRKTEILDCMRAVTMVLDDKDRAPTDVVTKRFGDLLYSIEWNHGFIDLWVSK